MRPASPDFYGSGAVRALADSGLRRGEDEPEDDEISDDEQNQEDSLVRLLRCGPFALLLALKKFQHLVGLFFAHAFRVHSGAS